MTADSTTTYIESDSIAILRNGSAIKSISVYLDANNNPFINLDGVWRAVSELENFERYEKRRRKKLYDTARNRMVEV